MLLIASLVSIASTLLSLYFKNPASHYCSHTLCKECVHNYLWRSEGQAWPGTCLAKATMFVLLVCVKRNANGLAYSKCPANTNDLVLQQSSKSLFGV